MDTGEAIRVFAAILIGAATDLAKDSLKSGARKILTLVKRKYTGLSIDRLQEPSFSPAILEDAVLELQEKGAFSDTDMVSELVALKRELPPNDDSVQRAAVLLERIKSRSVSIRDVVAHGPAVAIRDANIEGDIQVHGVESRGAIQSPK